MSMVQTRARATQIYEFSVDEFVVGCGSWRVKRDL